MSDGFNKGWQDGYDDTMNNHEVVVHIIQDELGLAKYFSHVSIKCDSGNMRKMCAKNSNVHGYDAGFAEGFIRAGGEISSSFDKEKYCKENNISIKNKP